MTHDNRYNKENQKMDRWFFFKKKTGKSKKDNTIARLQVTMYQNQLHLSSSNFQMHCVLTQPSDQNCSMFNSVENLR